MCPNISFILFILILNILQPPSSMNIENSCSSIAHRSLRSRCDWIALFSCKKIDQCSIQPLILIPVKLKYTSFTYLKIAANNLQINQNLSLIWYLTFYIWIPYCLVNNSLFYCSIFGVRTSFKESKLWIPNIFIYFGNRENFKIYQYW